MEPWHFYYNDKTNKKRSNGITQNHRIAKILNNITRNIKPHCSLLNKAKKTRKCTGKKPYYINRNNQEKSKYLYTIFLNVGTIYLSFWQSRTLNFF